MPSNKLSNQQKQQLKDMFLIECGTLKVTFPDHIKAIEEQEKIIRGKSTWIGNFTELSKNFQAFKEGLNSAKQKIDTAKKAESELQEQEAREKIKRELASFKLHLLAACYTPEDIHQHKFYELASGLKKEMGKLSDFSAIAKSKGLPSVFIEVFTKYYKEFEAYDKEQDHILATIRNVLSIDEKEVIAQKVKNFQEIVTSRLTSLRNYQNMAERQIQLFQELQNIEYQLPRGLFSPFDEKSGDDDKLALDSHGRYCEQAYPLAQQKIKPNKVFEELYNDIKNRRSQILIQLAKETHVEDKKENKGKPATSCIVLLATYKEKVTNMAKKISEHNEYLRQKTLTTENLKLDKNNLEHLLYWHNHTAHCWHGLGGTKIKLGNDLFSIPSRVYRMMQTVASDHENTASFNTELNRVRTSSLSSNPILYFSLFSNAYRSHTTSLLYSVKDEAINTHRV
jgi:hypothetical protein